MTTVSEVLEGQFPAAGASTEQTEGAGARARVRARLSDTLRDSNRSWPVRFARTVAADFAGAWWWHGSPPSLAELWANRIPDLNCVPGRNRLLWAAWAVYNHAVAAVMAVTYPVLWWAAHPARMLLTAAVAVPLLFVWI